MAPTVPQKVGTVERIIDARGEFGTMSELLLVASGQVTHRQYDTANALTLQHVEQTLDKWMVRYLTQ